MGAMLAIRRTSSPFPAPKSRTRSRPPAGIRTTLRASEKRRLCNQRFTGLASWVVMSAYDMAGPIVGLPLEGACCLALARCSDRKVVDAAHFIVAQHGFVLEEVLYEVERVRAPEHFAVDDEARHAEHPASRGVGG